jgi:hypothetical protein
MKYFILILSSFLFGKATKAQDITPKDSIVVASLIIKVLPIPFLFEGGIDGKIQITKQELVFRSSPALKIQKELSAIFPSNQHLIKSIVLKYSNIEKIRRRSYLFIFPNRLRIVMKDGESYLFHTWKRKKIIIAYNLYVHN